MVQKIPQKIKKRDGRIVPFDIQKITAAIFKAGHATGEFGKKEAQKISDLVVERLFKEGFDGNLATVEEVQDIVEEAIMRGGFLKTAKAYILYRELHRRAREIGALVDVEELIGGYIDRLDWRVRENANMTYSLQGLNIHVSTAVSAKYWLNQLYAPEAKDAHEEGDLHIHDLYLLAPYCCGWELKDFLIHGFGGVPGKIESRPPNHFKTALGQLVNFLYTLQGEAAGAEAVSSFDTLLAPFIHYDGLNYKQVKQAIQEFLFNMNVPTRVGFQTPFTNVTLDLEVPNYMKKEPVIIKGELQKKTYGDFQKEMDMFNQAFAEMMMEGDAKGRVFTFPIPTYNITKDFKWERKVLEPVWEMTAKYGIPYFANFVNADMKPEDARSMCFPGNTKIIYKEGKNSRYRRTTIRNLVNNWNPKKDFYLFINGKWVEIRESFKLKNTSGKIVKVTLKNGEVIKMTPAHPAMIVENGNLKQVSAKDLKIGDIVPIAKQVYEGRLGDFDLGRFLGLYVSEGGITKENTVYFSFNKREKELQEFVRKIAEERFAFPVHTTEDPRWDTVQVWVKSRASVEWVKKYCTTERASKKHLLSPLYGMSEDFRLGVLVGVFQGDGYERDVELHTTNKRLRDDIADLARSIGINYTKRTNLHNTKGETQFTSYVLRLCRDSLRSLLPYFKSIRASTSSIFKDFGKFYGVKIKSIKIQNYHAPVYDFEVNSNEHLFQLANGVITHNCCRLRLDNRELRRRGGGFFGANPLTGSIGVVTINLPRIAYLSRTKKEFFERLEDLMGIARRSLIAKRRVLENFTENGLYPYSRVFLSKIKQGFGKYWYNHFSTIGIIGGNEACLNLFGKNLGTQEGQKFMRGVLDFMNDRLRDFQAKDDQMYNLEATPAEGTSYRLARIDKEKYADIIFANKEAAKRGAAPYYTNSTQLPVDLTDDLFEALDLQDELQCQYSGGTVFHSFLQERPPAEMIKKLVQRITKSYSLPYFTITPTFSICMEHGYIAGEHKTCPKCERECEVYSRVVGYLRPVKQWNAGKQEEFNQRLEFKQKK